MNAVKRIAAVGLVSVTLPVVGAEIPALHEEIQWLQAEQYVTTATKTREQVGKSGASVTVITREQLQLMGARSLSDALKHVPGFGINQVNVGVASVEVRGITTDFSEKVLFLINGHPVNNNLVNGGALLSRDDFPVRDIQAIEVVRGPGSALYGANAFVAVINVVTQSAEDIGGTQINVAAGSYETGEVNLAHGESADNWDLALNLNVFSTDGEKRYVERDALGNEGETDYWQQRYELGVQGRVNNLRFQGRYLERDAGDYLGAFSVVNDGSEQQYTEYFVELGYEAVLSSRSELVTTVYYDYFAFDNIWEFTPDFFLRSPIKHNRTGLDLQWNIRPSNNHKWLLGAMAEHQEQYDVELWSNGGSGPLVNVSDTQNWNGEHNRDILAAFVQDIWDPTDDVRVIAGARYDRYSDFGGSFNPRVSVSWQMMPAYQLVASYGSAFRAPTFGEVYNTENNSVVGNPDLKPEEIDTLELGLNMDIGRRSRAKVTGFYNLVDDAIIPKAGSNSVNYSENAGEVRVMGIEMEYQTRFANGSHIDANYTYQDPENKADDVRVADVPLHRANLMFHHRFSAAWKGYVGALYESSLSRTEGDDRDEVPAQTTVDMALTWVHASQNLQVTGGVYNALDEDLVNPSRDVYSVGMSDFPAEGRSVMVSLEYVIR